jgi:cell division GTPase FtsZ
MITIKQYNKTVTPEDKEALAGELCGKYVRDSIVTVEPKDFLSIMEGVDALSITEVDGDNMAEMTHELTKHSYGSKLLVLLNSSPNDDLTMEDMACVNRWLSTLGESTDVIWGAGRKAECLPHFQMVVVTTNNRL